MIALWNLEDGLINIALEKIRMYYEQEGEQVTDYLSLEHHIYDKIYCSSIFDYTPKDQVPEDVICGGSGFDYTTTLPEEIDCMNPKINMGFTTRGCIRNCKFCIVYKKEGSIKAVGDIYDFWDHESKKLTILDNNILAMPDYFKMICGQIQKENLEVDFNQGLDCRLLTEELAMTLKSIRCRPYRFAFDNLDYTDAVVRAIKIINDVKLIAPTWYVYCDDFESAMERLLILKRHGQICYLMRDRKITDQQKFRPLASWSSRRDLFHGMDFYDYVKFYYNQQNSIKKQAVEQELII